MDAFQEYNYERNKLGSYSCFILASKLEKSFGKEEYIEAVKKLVGNRKLLRCNVIDRKVVQVAVDIRSLVEFVETDDDIVSFIDCFHDTTFKTDCDSDVLWKLVINGQWVVLLCDHTLFDGNTGVFIIEDLYSLLRKQEIPNDIVMETGSLCKPSLWFIVKKLAAETFKGTVNYPFQELKKDTSTFHTLKKLIQLNNEQFVHLKTILKRERISLTAFLLYMNLQSLDKKEIRVNVPINLRKFLKKEYERSYGLCVSAIDLDLKLGLDWDYARWINSKLSKSDQKDAASLVGMLDFVNKRTYLESKINKPRETTLEISNLGRRDTTDIEQFIFSQPNNHSGPLITNDIISTDKYINILVSAAPEAEPFFAEYVANLESSVRQIE